MIAAEDLKQLARANRKMRDIVALELDAKAEHVGEEAQRAFKIVCADARPSVTCHFHPSAPPRCA